MRTRQALVAALIAVAVSGCEGSTHAGHIDFFRVGPGAREVTVHVGVDKPAPSVEAFVVEESDTFVRVRVEVGNKTVGLDEDHPVIGVGEMVTRTVTLQAPLGSRVVQNEDGSEVLPEPTKTS